LSIINYSGLAGYAEFCGFSVSRFGLTLSLFAVINKQESIIADLTRNLTD
jgi:hypothetical protein